jgi:lipoprotein-releasing system permease protein
MMEALASKGDRSTVAVVKGIFPERELRLFHRDGDLVAGTFALLVGGPSPGIVIGQLMADRLGAQVGDTVEVQMPPVDAGVRGLPQRFRLVGVFRIGFEEYDRHLVYLDLRSAQALAGEGDVVSAVELRLRDRAQAEDLALRIEKDLGPGYGVIGPKGIEGGP